MFKLSGSLFDQHRQTQSNQLKQAIQNNNLEQVKQYISEFNYLVNEPLDNYNLKPLHYAVITKNEAITEFLLNAQGIDVDCVDNEVNTALVLAIEHGLTDLAYLLLEKGANPDKPEGAHQKPLHIAAMEGHSELVSHLVAHEQVDLDCQDAIGQTALHVVCPSDQGIAITQTLLDAGCDPNIEDMEGKTPLDRAYEEKAHERIQLLEERFALAATVTNGQAEGLGIRLSESPNQVLSDTEADDSLNGEEFAINELPCKRRRFG